MKEQTNLFTNLVYVSSETTQTKLYVTEKVTISVFDRLFNKLYEMTGTYKWQNRPWQEFDYQKATIDLAEKTKQPRGLIDAMRTAKNHGEQKDILRVGFVVDNDFARLKTTW